MFSDQRLGITQHYGRYVIKGVQISGQHVLLRIEHANGLSIALRIDLFDAAAN
jgi:hypothetical protein